MKPLRYMASMIPSPMIPCMAPAIALAYRRALLRRMPAAAAVIAPPTLPSSGCCCALPLTSPSPPISDDAPFRWALASPPELEPLTALPPPLLRMLLLLPYRGATHGEDIGKSEGESITLRSMSECGISSPERSQAVAAASSTSIVKGERGAWGAAAHGPEAADPAWR